MLTGKLQRILHHTNVNINTGTNVVIKKLHTMVLTQDKRYGSGCFFFYSNLFF